MTMTRRIRTWRRVAEVCQAAVIVGLPFLKINGESALRFDVPSLQLYFFGLDLWMEEFFIVLIAVIFLSLLVILFTLLLGRIWCGWMCPQTVIADFTSFVDRVKYKGIAEKVVPYSATFVISLFVAANLIWYFVSPYDFFPRLLEGRLGDVIWWFWIVLTAILFLNFVLVRRTFCATVCPYAKLQSTLFDSRTLLVAFDPRRRDECIECMACVRTCPVGIDIRKGQNAACIHCAECIDSCTGVMMPRRKKSLIGYFFGQPGDRGKILRLNVVLIGLVTAAFLAFFVYLLYTRVPVDMTVLPNYSFQPRINSEGKAINSYIISLRNMGRKDLDFKIVVQGNSGMARIVPDGTLHVKAGYSKNIPVYITISDVNRKKEVRSITLSVVSADDDTLTVTKKANFIFPEDE